MERILIVFIGGGIGSATRYLATVAAAKLAGTDFPWGTLFVNLAGCFIIGVMLAIAERTELAPPSFRLFFVAGFLGGMTTFSSYAMETVFAARSGMAAALINIAANNIAGIAMVVCGMKLARLFI
ncbi:MAG: fluoride efflux transporter CrcB [Elusimicrobiales bacterium]